MVLCCGLFLCLCLFCFFFLFCCFSYMDSYMDYVKVRLLSFVAIQCDGLACFSQFNHSKNKPVLRPGESHEGVGRKKTTLFFRPTPSWLLPGRSIQVTYNTFKSHATSCKNIPKNRAVKTVDKLNCKTMTTVKTVVYIVQ